MAAAAAVCLSASAAEVTVAGVRIVAPGDLGVAAESLGKHRLRITLPPGAPGAVELNVTLPPSGANWWPAADVVVRDSRGQLVPRTHSGSEWYVFSFRASPTASPYTLQCEPAAPPPPVVPEQTRTAADEQSGLTVAVCKWYGGRKAALCMRFDDSHPSHLAVAIPILDSQGFRATFMVNPGRASYIEHKAQWEAVARGGRHELADHTMHHHGAQSDDEAEHEIGDAARYLQGLLPAGRSPLLALNLGGGTKWTVTRPLRYFLAKYKCFLVTGSLGMDDVYGGRVEALRKHIEANIKRGGWCKAHWHYIGPGLSTSEENFRAEMAIVAHHRQRLWICGLTEAYKYLTERRATSLKLQRTPRGWKLTVDCRADPKLFDQPLTLSLTAPAALAGRLRILDAQGRALKLRPAAGEGTLLVDVPPRTASYTIVARP